MIKYLNDLLDERDLNEPFNDLVEKENKLFQSIFSIFQNDILKENEFLLKLQKLIIKNNEFIATPLYEDLDIMGIILFYINNSNTNTLNAMICLDSIICYLDVNHLRMAIESGLLEIIKKLIDQNGLDSRAGFGYLANLCYHNDLHEIILENFEIFALIPFLTIDPNNYSFSIIINIIINLIPEISIDFFNALLDHFSSFEVNVIPINYLVKILELLNAITVQRSNDLNSIIKQSNFLQNLLSIDLINSNNSNEAVKRNQYLLHLFLSLDIDIDIKCLLYFITNEEFSQSLSLLLNKINKKFQENEENLHFFIENNGLILTLKFLENGNFDIKKQAILTLTAILTAFEYKTTILQIISDDHITLILDLLDPEENDQFYIACYIGLLLSLINIEHQVGQSRILQFLIDNDIDDHIHELKYTDKIDEYIETFLTMFHELCQQNEL